MYTIEEILTVFLTNFRHSKEDFLDYLEMNYANPFLIEETKVILDTFQI